MSLLETIVAIALEAVVLSGLTTSLLAATEMTATLRTQRGRTLETHRLEQLIDHGITLAGTGPAHPPAVAEAEAKRLVLHADLNGDSSIDPRSAERIELIVRSDGSTQRLVHRIGRQSATIARELTGDASFTYLDALGRATIDRSEIRLVHVPAPDGQIVIALRPGQS